MPVIQREKSKGNTSKYLLRKDETPSTVDCPPILTVIQRSERNNSQNMVKKCYFPPQLHLQMRK